MPETATRTIRVKPSRPQFDLITSQKQINLFLAGQGSGKSHAAGIISGTFINQFPGVRGFIGANTYLQLSDSTLFRIRSVWKEFFGWSEFGRANPRGNYVIDVQPPAHFSREGHEFDSYYGKICFKSGTVIYKGSLDNYKAHDGKEFGWALLDETKDTKEEAVKEVILGRLRQPGMFTQKGEPWNPLFILTSPAKVPWINEWFGLDDFTTEIVSKIYSEETYFRKEIDNKLVVISSAYHNQRNLPANFLSNQMKNLTPGLRDLLIYANPFASTGGEFYKCFSRLNNVIDNKKIHGKPELYDEKLPLHISFDFNTSPYMTCTIWQIKGKKVKAIDEICLESPRNRTRDVCEEFALRYHDHTAGLFVYGDPAGKHEDTRTEKGENDFTKIMGALRKFRPSLRVAKMAPPVKGRGDFMNVIFEQGYDNIEVLIGSNCGHLIADLTYGKEASDGTKLKEKAINPQTKVSSEKYHHCSDSMDYFMTMAFAREFAQFQTNGASGKMQTGKAGPTKNDY